MSSPENTLDPRALGSAGSPLGGGGDVCPLRAGGILGRLPGPTVVESELLALVALPAFELERIGFKTGRGSARGGLGGSGRR